MQYGLRIQLLLLQVCVVGFIWTTRRLGMSTTAEDKQRDRYIELRREVRDGVQLLYPEKGGCGVLP